MSDKSQHLGNYVIVGKLGAGSMGTVYRGVDPRINRPVAIKVISRELSTSEEIRSRFIREARSAGSLSHRNIVTIYELGDDRARLFIAMEYLEGRTLRRVIDEGDLSLASRLDVMIQICDGLHHAHQHGVVHRDVKPGNIFLLPDGTVKILDFGLARTDTSDLTKSGIALGTPSYMAPEQILGQAVRATSDVFSAGCVFYELISGLRAFSGDSIPRILFRITREDPAPLHEVKPDLPADLCAVITRMLAKRAADRPQSLAEVGTALRSIGAALRPPPAAPDSTGLKAVPPRAAQATIAARRMGKWGALALIAAVAVAAMIAAGMAWRGGLTFLPAWAPRPGPSPAATATALRPLQGVGATATAVAAPGGDREAERAEELQTPPPMTTAAEQPPEKAPRWAEDLAAARELLAARDFAGALALAQPLLGHQEADLLASTIVAAAEAALEAAAAARGSAEELLAAGRAQEALYVSRAALAQAPNDRALADLVSRAESELQQEAIAREARAASQRQTAMAAKARYDEAATQLPKPSDQRPALQRAIENAGDLARNGEELFASGEYRAAEVAFEAARQRLAAALAGAQRQELAAAAATATALTEVAAARLTPAPVGGGPTATATGQELDRKKIVPGGSGGPPIVRPGAEPTATPDRSGSLDYQLRAVLEQYAKALATKDMRLLESAWPTIDDTTKAAIAARFADVETRRVEIEPVGKVIFAPSGLSLQCRMVDTVVTVDGEEAREERRQTFLFKRFEGRWRISAVR
ncbi:MAG: protein kinase [Candidatus Schekmanbacteria bacterium]|nr:protein kinase [Candidatus Schekmanbacteria bacterium]